MSKMSDMAQTIEELRNAAVAINDATDWLFRQFSGCTRKGMTQKRLGKILGFSERPLMSVWHSMKPKRGHRSTTL